MSETFGKRLARLRAEAKLSQRELAEAAGITHPQISRYERGSSIPRLQVLMALAEALKVDLSTISGGAHEGFLGHDTGERPYTPQELREKLTVPLNIFDGQPVSRQTRRPDRTKLEIKVMDEGISTIFKSLEDGAVLTRAIQGFLRDYVNEIYFDEPDLLEALRTYRVSEVKLTFVGDGNGDDD